MTLFHEKVQLKCAILLLLSGHNPSLLVLWCISSDPTADQLETEEAQAHVNVMKHLLKYTLE